MGRHLGVGLRSKGVAFADQPRPQIGVILDDAVVNECKRTAAILMRVRILIGRSPVSGPPGVPEPGAALGQRILVEHDFKVRQRAGLAPYVHQPAVQNCDACRVVAAVFESPQTGEDDVTSRLWSDVGHDAAHGLTQPLAHNPG